MATAVAIAYDWLYDALPISTKDLVKKCLYERAIVRVLREYEKGSLGSWAKRETNWNVVCNTGMVLAALGIAEDYPKEAAVILDNAAKYMPNCLKHFAPDGARRFIKNGHLLRPVVFLISVMRGLMLKILRHFSYSAVCITNLKWLNGIGKS